MSESLFECARCGSHKWSYCDYGGCSECRPHEDRAAEDEGNDLCDYVPTINPDGTVLG